MAQLTPRELLTQAREAGLDVEVPPIAIEATLLDGYEADDPRTLQEPSMLLTPVPHPIFEAFMTTSGATRRGRLTWVVGMGRETFNPTPLVVLRDRLQRGTLYLESTAATSKSPKDLFNVAGGTAHTALTTHFAGGAAAGILSRQGLERVANAAHPRTGAGQFGAVTVSGDHGMTYIKVVTHQLTVPEHLPQIALNLRPAGKPFTDPRPVRPAEAMAVLEWLMEQGVHISDPSENNDVAVIRRKLSTSIVAYPTPGRPALAETAIGRKVFAQASDILGDALAFEEPAAKQATTRGRLSAEQVMSLVHAMPDANAVHPGTIDVGNLAHATPVDDERLRPYQREAVGLHLATDIGYLQCSAPGMGKGHPVDTKVLTPRGWRRVGDLRVGDEVIGSNGHSTRVTGVYPRGELDVFRVHFNDRSSVVVDADHLWQVRAKSVPVDAPATAPRYSTTQKLAACKLRANGATYEAAAKSVGASVNSVRTWAEAVSHEGEQALEPRRRTVWQVRETRDLAETLTTPNGERRWRIPMTSPVEFDGVGKRPVPAYTLGAILGDGGTTTGPVRVFTVEPDMADLLRADLPAGYEVVKTQTGDRCPALAIVTRPDGSSNGVKNGLRELGLYGLRAEEKFVPDAYLFAPLADRIALFQGLMDTDGSYAAKTRRLEFSSSSEALADAVAFLVESFGGTARKSVKVPTYTHAGEKRTGLPHYRVGIALPRQIVPFRLVRKISTWQPRRFNPTRVMTKVEPAGKADVVCISVEAQDRLYLTEHCIVTHNTVMAYGAMERRAARTPGYRGLVVAEANVRAQWVTESEDWFPGAHVVRVESRDDAPKLARALADTNRPVVAVISYGLLPAVSTEMARREALAEAGETVHATPVAPQTLEADPGAEASGDWEDMLPGVDAAIADRPEPVATAFAEIPLSKAAQDMGQFDLFSLLVTDEPATIDAAEAPEADAQEEADPFADVELGALLIDQFWHDIIADEAEVLRGTGSKANAAMWKLRMNSQVAVALTGTPINKGVDDLGRLMSWARGDVHLFHGVRLSEQFDLNTDEGLAAFTEAMGPLLFRRDTSEIADELPEITPVVMKLTPSAPEKALAGAARAELKRVYEELLSAIELAEELSEDEEQSEALAEAKGRLTEARGAWLGGTTLARMASSDPAALLGSTSAGAALLAGQGLIEAATAQPGTKRTAVVADVTNRVANGEKVLIFTEFATVARGVIDDLDAAGVRVGEVLGGGGRKRDAMVVGFQRGDLDVLVCTSSGERGLNLQQATTIVHYDLPWTPKGVIQRTGRAMRIKSQNSKVTVVFPLMEGTIEERVAAMVVTRAVEAMRALDASRGVDTSRTEMGQALGGLVTALDDMAVGRTGNAVMDMTAALVAA